MVNNAASFDPDVFLAFEYAGWQRVSDQYTHSFANLTIQAAEPLLDASNVQHGMDVLDIATGQGDIAALAAQRGAHAIGIDFSDAMVTVAGQRYPSIRFQKGNAEALPFDDNSFDAVVINFGLLHFSRPEQALREAQRVLRANAKISFTVWSPPEEAPGFALALQALADHGEWQVALPIAPDTFQFSDEQECARTLLHLGFSVPTVTHLTLSWELPSSDALFTAMHEGTVRTGSMLRAQQQEALAAIRRSMKHAAQAYEKDDKLVVPMSAVLVSALRLAC